MQCTWVVLTYMTMVHVRKKIALDLLALIWSMAALYTQKCRGILEILFFQNTSLNKCNLTLWPCSFTESNLHNYPIVTSENAIRSTKSTKLCIVNITWNAIMKLSSCDYESKCIYLTTSSSGHYKQTLYVLVCTIQDIWLLSNGRIVCLVT